MGGGSLVLLSLSEDHVDAPLNCQEDGAEEQAFTHCVQSCTDSRFTL